MRVFIAVDLPEEIRARFKELQTELRPLTSSARWVAPESIHVTLKFIGEVPEERIPDIDAGLGGLSGEPFSVSVHGVGFFPETRAPRVFWAGMEGPALVELARNVEKRLSGAGFEKEKRAFQPHVTLARARDIRFDASLVAAASKYSGHMFGEFTVDRVFLFQSTLKPTGAVYNELKEYRLGG